MVSLIPTCEEIAVEALTIERTFDLALIRELGTHPKVFNGISDDDTPSKDNWFPIDHPAIVYLLARIDGQPVGYWMLHPHASYLWECHTVLTPVAWGVHARKLAALAIEWVWTNTQCKRLFTHVPEFNRVALRFALACGLTEYGRQPNAFLKGGKMWTVIELGVSKPIASTVEEVETFQQL